MFLNKLASNSYWLNASTIRQNKDGPYRISVHQYSYLKSKQTRVLKISIKNYKEFRNVRKT